MSNPAELAKLIQVIHREPGFLRLELPAELCGAAAATALEQGMLKLSGLQSAAVDRNWQRISLRYDAAACSTPQVARHLFGLLDGLPLSEAESDEDPASPSANASASAASSTEAGFSRSGPLGQQAAGMLKPVLAKARQLLAPPDNAPADSLHRKLQPVLASALTEKAIINFFNDMVAFYLIKAHWDLITKRWLKEPLAHSSAWMTTFYLIFLLVRYRKTK